MKTITFINKKYLLLIILSCFIFLISSAQVTLYPAQEIIEGVNFNNVTHDYFYPTTIISPHSTSYPINFSGTSKITYTAGSQIELNPGFESGDFTGDGNFIAQIDTGLKMILIAPDPSTAIQSGLVHVPQWEKFEVGFNLPKDYLAAVTNFFTYYDDYNNSTASAPVGTPMLNPYADDSLEVQILFTRPNGSHVYKWAFFMRVADFLANDVQTFVPSASGGAGAYFGPFSSEDGQVLGDNTSDPLHPFNWRFRFAPDVQGDWSFAVTISNPQNIQGFPTYTFTGFPFVCDPPISNDPILPDNHGFLQVNTTNKRYLQFSDGSSFFGMGLNMPSPSHGHGTDANFNAWRFDHFYKDDFDDYIQTLDEMHETGANYIRKFLSKADFAIEWDNLGVYDKYESSSPCNDGFMYSGYWKHTGNRQYNLWAFDKFFDQARKDNIYLQLCVQPYPAIIAFQTFIWGDNAYSRYATDQSSNITSSLTYFSDETLRYYWKRQYKYLLSRYGYSVNLAALESFNKVDQTFNYYRSTYPYGTTCAYIDNPYPTPDTPIDNQFDHNNISDITDIRNAVSDWHDDIFGFVKSTLNSANPHLTEVSFVPFAIDQSNDIYSPLHYNIFNSTNIDLTDIHYSSPSFLPALHNTSQPKDIYSGFYDLSHNFMHGINSFYNFDKPFHFGEGYTSGSIDVPNVGEVWTAEYYNNYELSFHNDLWATAFMGDYTTGLTWAFEPVHWWPNSLPQKLTFYINPITHIASTKNVDNILGNTNGLLGDLYLPSGSTAQFTNKKTYFQYTRLAAFMQQIDLSSISDARKDIQADVECYYLLSGGTNSGTDNIKAYGWIHNMNKYWYNNYYYYVSSPPSYVYNYQNYNNCPIPSIPTQGVTLTGMLPNESYNIDFFYTGLDTPPASFPQSQTLSTQSSSTGDLTIDSSILNFLVCTSTDCDQSNADFAFVVSLQSNLRVSNDTNQNNSSVIEPNVENEDYLVSVSPNPSEDIFSVMVQNTRIDDATILYFVVDDLGKPIYSSSGKNNSVTLIDLGNQPKGIYLLKTSVNNVNKYSKLVKQ